MTRHPGLTSSATRCAATNFRIIPLLPRPLVHCLSAPWPDGSSRFPADATISRGLRASASDPTITAKRHRLRRRNIRRAPGSEAGSTSWSPSPRASASPAHAAGEDGDGAAAGLAIGRLSGGMHGSSVAHGPDAPPRRDSASAASHNRGFAPPTLCPETPGRWITVNISLAAVSAESTHDARGAHNVAAPPVKDLLDNDARMGCQAAF